MRISFITLLLLVIPFTSVAIADEKSDCLNSCANDKRTNDMYCPPSGGFTDEDNKQCRAKNSADFKSCTNSCSPQAPPLEETQAESDQTAPAAPDDSIPADRQD